MLSVIDNLWFLEKTLSIFVQIAFNPRAKGGQSITHVSPSLLSKTHRHGIWSRCLQTEVAKLANSYTENCTISNKTFKYHSIGIFCKDDHSRSHYEHDFLGVDWLKIQCKRTSSLRVSISEGNTS